MIRINLLPEGTRKSHGGGLARFRPSLPEGGLEDLRPENPWSVALLATVLLAAAGVTYTWWSVSSRNGELQARIEEARDDSARLQELHALTDSLIARREAVQERLRLVTRLDRNRYVWPHLLDELSRALPSAAWLTSVTEETPGEAVTVTGVAANPLAITTYVRELEGSEQVARVDLLGSQRVSDAPGGAQEFTVVVRYRQGGGGGPGAPAAGASPSSGGG